jgi:hypothetical protein
MGRPATERQAAGAGSATEQRGRSVVGGQEASGRGRAEDGSPGDACRIAYQARRELLNGNSDISAALRLRPPEPLTGPLTAPPASPTRDQNRLAHTKKKPRTTDRRNEFSEPSSGLLCTRICQNLTPAPLRRESAQIPPNPPIQGGFVPQSPLSDTHPAHPAARRYLTDDDRPGYPRRQHRRPNDEGSNTSWMHHARRREERPHMWRYAFRVTALFLIKQLLQIA